MEPDITPYTREEIVHYSFQYQNEWRFEREKRIIQHALKLFPDWKYLQDRMEWHSHPIFHRDPEKSKTQPRKPLHLPRDPNYIPKQETIDSMCFVTGTSSNGSYFDLAVQLIESIKATRWYNYVPIKVLDCGLTQGDADYLRNKFGCEVKDPGWMVPFESVTHGSYHLNGLKSMAARHHIHDIFQGYEYYCWLDCDTWIQHELFLDSFLKISETQSFCILATGDIVEEKSYKDLLDKKGLDHFYHILKEKNSKISNGSAIIGNRLFFQKYQQHCSNYVNNQKHFFPGVDDFFLLYTAYEIIETPIFNDQYSNYCNPYENIMGIDSKKNIVFSGEILGLISLVNQLKVLPYSFLSTEKLGDNFIQRELLSFKDKPGFEEKLHQLCITHKYNIGNYYYRIYPNPYQLYGEISEVFK